MSTAKLGFHTFRFLYGRKWTMLLLGLWVSQLRSLRFQQTWIIWTALNGISGRHFNYTHRFSKFLTVDLNDSSVICCPNWFSSRSIPLKTSFSSEFGVSTVDSPPSSHRCISGAPSAQHCTSSMTMALMGKGVDGKVRKEASQAISNHVLLLMVQKSQTTTRDV